MNPTTPTNEDPTVPQADPVVQDTTTDSAPLSSDSVAEPTAVPAPDAGSVTETVATEAEVPVSSPEPTAAPVEQAEVSSVEPASETTSSPTTIDATQTDPTSSPATEQIDEEAL